MKTKFFRLFWILHPVEKQAYKLKLPKKYRFYNVFHVSLLEQNTIKKGQVDNNITKLDTGDNDSKMYKVGAIWDNAIYAKES